MLKRTSWPPCVSAVLALTLLAFGNSGARDRGPGPLQLGSRQAGQAPEAAGELRFIQSTDDYQLDDGTAENSIGTGSNGEIITWYVWYTIIPGSEILASVNVESGISPGDCDGLAVTVAVLDDPDGDGDPTDAEIIETGSGTLGPSGDNVTIKISLDAQVDLDATVTSPNDRFFVAAQVTQTVDCGFPASQDQTGGTSPGENPARNYIGIGALSDCPNQGGGGGAGCPVDCAAENCCPGCGGDWLLRANAVTPPPIIYVDQDATGAADGSSWCDAFTTLQDGLAAAQSGDTVRVAQGTYKPDLGGGQTPGDRSASFSLISGVTIEGSYAGCGQPDPDLRDFNLYLSTMSGDLIGDDGPDFLLNDENSYHVVNGIIVDDTAVLDGFAISGGNANGGSPEDTGAGLFITDGSPRVYNCRFTSNYALLAGGGAARSDSGRGTPLFDSCSFQACVADFFGGGVANLGILPGVVIKNCTFESNILSAVGTAGGGVYSHVGLSISKSTFENNAAAQGGAIYTHYGTLTNCILAGNSASTAGGAVAGTSTVDIIGCVLTGNTSNGVGGAIAASAIPGQGSVNLRLCTLAMNTAATAGGGLYHDGAVIPSTTISNSILWGNSDAGGTDESAQVHVAGGSVTVDYSIVQGLTGGLGGTGNSGADPLLLDPDGADNDPGTLDDDVHLPGSSPAIDAGSNAAVPADEADVDGDANTAEPLPLDLNGDPRIADGDGDLQSDVDMGAYELQGPDCDGDGIPNDEEIANCSGDPACADCDGNGVPDGCDIAGCDPLTEPSCADCNLNGRPDGCDIADLTSADDNMDGVPDECALFVGLCPGSDAVIWSCPANWLLDDPADDYPDNGLFGGPFHVVLDGVDDVFLDVSSVINTLVLSNQSVLSITAAPGPGPSAGPPLADLVVTDPGGIACGGTILMGADRSIDAAGRVAIRAGGFYGADPESAEAVSAAIEAGNVEIYEGPPGAAGTMDLSGGMLAGIGGSAVLFGGDDDCSPPIMRTSGAAAMAIGGDLVIIGGAEVDYASSEPLVLGGDFANQSDAPLIFDWLGGALCIGACPAASTQPDQAPRLRRELAPGPGASGVGGIAAPAAGPGSTHAFEVAGQDLGAVYAGLLENFAIGTLTIDGGAEVTFADAFDNDGQGQAPCSEALYVATLVLGAGSTITLDGVNIYYVELIDNGATVNTPGCGALLAAPDCQEPCADGDACTTADACVNHVCTGGPAPDCDDDNPCTTDGCDTQNGCTNDCLAPATPCDAGRGPASGACSAGCSCELVAPACPAQTLQECADLNNDDIRDDNCLWWECVGGVCQSTPISFADMGGGFGDCGPDGAADGNDRFHTLNCFSDQDTSGAAGYPCEADPPMALNVDAGGSFGNCAPDGVCDGNDAFAALNAFAGSATCSCPRGSAGPAPTSQPFVVAHTSVSLRPSRSVVRRGDVLQIDVLLDQPLEDLRGYQLHARVSGGSAGRLELIDMTIEKRRQWVFRGAAGWQAFNVSVQQMLAGLSSNGITTPAEAYLATFVFQASADAAGRFVIDLAYDEPHGQARTFLFATPPTGKIQITRTDPAVVRIAGRGT